MKLENRLSGISKILLVVAAVFLAANIYLPIWQIELHAPQYPEGLVLKIYADKLGGNVEIINGLNHYIGMQTLHAENFIEFSILRYILGFFAVFMLVIAVIGRKKGAYILFVSFVLFSVLAMADFYRWNYNYGHNLDPNAAIKVPGMAYQPPLIGYKQLLNFGAYSIPDTGGLLFIGSGILLLLVVLIERKAFAKWFKQKPAIASALFTGILLFSLTSCGTPGPEPIKLNVDTCAYCRMTITDPLFASQLNTKKGRNYKFDDLLCLAAYSKENAQVEYDDFYVADFCSPAVFIKMDQAILLQGDSIRSPMGGNIAAFAVRDSAELYKRKFAAGEMAWTGLLH